MISASLPHLFEMQTSLLVHVNKDKIDLVVHIPSVAVNIDLQVYKMLTIPCPIPYEKEDQNYVEHMIMRSVAGQ